MSQTLSYIAEQLAIALFPEDQYFSLCIYVAITSLISVNHFEVTGGIILI